MKDIKQYEGVYGDKQMKFSTQENFIFTELIETRSRFFDWEIEPHIHRQLFQILYIKTGQVQFHGLDKIINLTTPCIITIPPMVLHGYTYSTDTTGHAFSIAEGYIDTILEDLSAVVIHFDAFRYIPIAEETQKMFNENVLLIEKIDEEIFADRIEKNAIIKSYLTQFFILLARQLRINEKMRKDHGNMALHYFREFNKNIKKSDFSKTIPDFAAELHISAVHLNRICKSVAGKSALHCVQEATIKKAQKYLTYTVYSVSEIAYLLKYDDPSYFAKIFKKYTGISPSEYRTRH